MVKLQTGDCVVCKLTVRSQHVSYCYACQTLVHYGNSKCSYLVRVRLPAHVPGPSDLVGVSVRVLCRECASHD